MHVQHHPCCHVILQSFLASLLEYLLDWCSYFFKTLLSFVREAASPLKDGRWKRSKYWYYCNDQFTQYGYYSLHQTLWLYFQSCLSLSQCSRIPVYLYIAAFALQNKQDHLQLLSTFRNFFIYKSLLILRYHIPVHPVLSAMIYQSLKILALED